MAKNTTIQNESSEKKEVFSQKSENQEVKHIKEKEIDLQSFLDTKCLSRAEKMFYQKTYGKIYAIKTFKEWSALTKLL